MLISLFCLAFFHGTGYRCVYFSCELRVNSDFSNYFDIFDFINIQLYCAVSSPHDSTNIKWNGCHIWMLAYLPKILTFTTQIIRGHRRSPADLPFNTTCQNHGSQIK